MAVKLPFEYRAESDLDAMRGISGPSGETLLIHSFLHPITKLTTRQHRSAMWAIYSRIRIRKGRLVILEASLSLRPKLVLITRP